MEGLGFQFWVLGSVIGVKGEGFGIWSFRSKDLGVRVWI